MTSNIDPTVPAAGADLDSAPIRNNFAVAQQEISDLQTALGGPAAVTSVTAGPGLTGGGSGGDVALALETPVSMDYGGTGATTPAESLANLGGAPLHSPAFTGTPTAPTPVPGDNSTSIATTAFVETAVGSVAGGGTPVGANGAVQYNNSGAMGGANVTVAPDTSSLTVPGNVNVGPFPAGYSFTDNYNTSIKAMSPSSAGFIGETYSGWQSYLELRSGQGTPAAPTNTKSGDRIADIDFSGWAVGATWGSGFTPGAQIRVFANEDWTGGARGSQIRIGTASGSEQYSDPHLRMTIGPGVTVGDSSLAPMADMGSGTLNVQNGYYLNGQPFGGFCESVGWLAGVNPNKAIIFINKTGRTLTVKRIDAHVEATGTATAIDVYSQTGSTALSSGTKISSSTLSLATAGPTALYTAGTATVPDGYRLGLVTASTTFDTGIATITVYLQ